MSQSISFQTEDIEFKLTEQKLTKHWISKVIQLEKGQLNFINYIFCSDRYLLKLNQQYLQHDTLTDIITFDYDEQAIESDVFISIERVKENAQTLQTDFNQELNRVMIHGVLHLLGYPDKTKEEKQHMRAKENEMLALLQTINV